ncbi:YitT family protein [Undibacter mobilis]|uniref:YitT family protein n=1 Tax=Undibacter mobilis TaxID=2292256 RepID=A0A371BE62_9BRAD|nr:YitT family protein [Undibacter mobilis]
MTDTDLPAPRHTVYEDVLAIITGTLFISFALAVFKLAGLLTGSTAGVAFLVFYTTGLPFGAVFFVINLPFYILAFLRMGWRFTAKTFVAVALTSVMTELHIRFIHITDVNPFYAAVFGGLLMGVGFIVLFRHQASLGGVNILALYVQDRYGVRAGKFQLVVDLTVLAASFFIVSPMALLASVIGACALNMVIWINHRHDRYIAWSAP